MGKKITTRTTLWYQVCCKGKLPSACIHGHQVHEVALLTAQRPWQEVIQQWCFLEHVKPSNNVRFFLSLITKKHWTAGHITASAGTRVTRNLSSWTYPCWCLEDWLGLAFGESNSVCSQPCPSGKTGMLDQESQDCAETNNSFNLWGNWLSCSRNAVPVRTARLRVVWLRNDPGTVSAMGMHANENGLFGWVWSHMLAIPTLRRLRQEQGDSEFQ